MAREWYYVDELDREIGPVDAGEIKRLIVEGSINRQTMIWRDDLPDWIKAGQIRKLFRDGGGGSASGPAFSSRRASTSTPVEDEDDWAGLAAAESYGEAISEAPVIPRSQPSPKKQKTSRRRDTGEAELGNYATFAERLCAEMIERVLFLLAVVGAGQAGIAISGDPDSSTTTLAIWGAILGWGFVLNPILLCSERQATLGKMALGLVVTDEDDQPLTYGKAAYRTIVKSIGVGILPITLISAVLFFRSPRKQFMHDTSAKTLVHKRR